MTGSRQTKVGNNRSDENVTVFFGDDDDRDHSDQARLHVEGQFDYYNF